MERCPFARFLPEINESILIKFHIAQLYSNLLLQVYFVPHRLNIIHTLHKVQVEIYNISH
jgi:hypothetical protein